MSTQGLRSEGLADDESDRPRVTDRLGARLAIGVVGLLLAGAIVVIAVAMSRGIGGDETGVTTAGFEVAPDFTLTSFDGKRIALAELGDRPLFIYFWASWCGPCELEAPVIQSVWPEYEARGYAFIGINILDNPSEAERFIERHGLTFATARDEQRTVYIDYGVAQLPEAFFVHPGFAVSARFSGELDETNLREQLEAISPGGEATAAGSDDS
jgi:cytochrome c biogenesis protein CcmG/thiol:disulfide interchange protein DsbE